MGEYLPKKLFTLGVHKFLKEKRSIILINKSLRDSVGARISKNETRIEKEYNDKYAEATANILDAQREVALVVDMLDDAVLKAVLKERYFNCGRWEDVAEVLNFSEGHVKRLHHEGLVKIEKLIRNETECY